MIRLYESAVSGNCYKVRLLLSQLGIPFERIEHDLAKGEARTPEFRGKFPLGRVPAVELDDGQVLAESNAILWYFGEGTRFVPADPLVRARCLQWMFWEQYSHEPYIAVARAWLAHFGVPKGKEAELRERQEKGNAALAVMERHLSSQSWFAGSRYSIADIALFAYTHDAAAGGYDLARFPAVREWIERVRNEAGFVPLDA